MLIQQLHRSPTRIRMKHSKCPQKSSPSSLPKRQSPNLQPSRAPASRTVDCWLAANRAMQRQRRAQRTCITIIIAAHNETLSHRCCSVFVCAFQVAASTGRTARSITRRRPSTRTSATRPRTRTPTPTRRLTTTSMRRPIGGKRHPTTLIVSIALLDASVVSEWKITL